MMTLAEFLDSKWSLIVFAGETPVFRSDESDLRPLVTYLAGETNADEPLIVFDRYVGRAAGLLFSLIEPVRVCAGVISEAGAATLDRFGIAYEAGQTVKYLMGVASKEMCRWEKLAMGKTAEELLSELREIYRSSD